MVQPLSPFLLYTGLVFEVCFFIIHYFCVCFSILIVESCCTVAQSAGRWCWLLDQERRSVHGACASGVSFWGSGRVGVCLLFIHLCHLPVCQKHVTMPIARHGGAPILVPRALSSFFGSLRTKGNYWGCFLLLDPYAVSDSLNFRRVVECINVKLMSAIEGDQWFGVLAHCNLNHV